MNIWWRFVQLMIFGFGVAALCVLVASAAEAGRITATWPNAPTSDGAYLLYYSTTPFAGCPSLGGSDAVVGDGPSRTPPITFDLAGPDSWGFPQGTTYYAAWATLSASGVQSPCSFMFSLVATPFPTSSLPPGPLPVAPGGLIAQ